MEENSPQNKTPLRRPVRAIPQENEKRKMRIKIWMGWALIITALCVDLIELLGGYISLEIIAAIVGFIASFIFWVWFLILGVPYSSNTKRFVMAIVTNVSEIIPGLDAVPFWFFWTAGMIIIIGMVRMEDKGESPTILGGLSEGLVLTQVLNPIGAITTMGINKTRRFVKKRAGVGQADWVKQNKKTHETMDNNNVLDLRNKNYG